MPEDSGSMRIGFRTAGVWMVVDLQNFVNSVSGIYDALHTARIRRRLEENYLESMEVGLERMAERAPHPGYYEIFRLWRDFLRSRRRGETLIEPFPFPFPITGFDLGAVIPSDRDILEDLARYANEVERLRVSEVQMASPGGFSFEGIGDIVREFRELVKDVWWRNRQERALGQLQVIDKYLSMRGEHPDIELPPPPFLKKDKYLADVLDGHINQLRELEERGRLESIPENIDYAPEP